MDLEYRKQWDSYVKVLQEEESGEDKVIYWEVKYPLPLSNRDYVYVRERRDLDVDGRKIFVVLAKSVSAPHCPEKSGIVRVNGYEQSVAIESDGKNGCKVFMYYFDNPGGLIPAWLVNWAAKSGVPNFLTNMQKACKGYEEQRTKTLSKK
ncbi:phosphatidylcholine transfer protein isoform X2 [Spea bombifrons]|nr:phosphatidylcholine transfer protein isoform X2 [Spea bombifrons]